MTELVFILDRSGSMAGLEADTIGGFNAMLEKQRRIPGEVLVSTVLFNGESEVIHDRVPLRDVPKMDGETYTVGGSTALLDAVGGAIRHIRNVHKYARPEDRPEKTLFVITTDGMENSSCRYTYRDVRRMLLQQEDKGWEFIFLGANIDAAAEAGRIGIRPERAADYHSDSDGTALNYDVLADAICSMRCTGRLKDNWAAPIRADYEKRRKR